MLVEHPISSSYWADPGRVLAGPHPGLGDREAQRVGVRALHAAGVRTVIDLTTPGEHPSIRVLFEKLAPDDAAWAWMNMPILDGGVPSRAGMQLVLDAIDASLTRSAPVYVHCMGGLGRTGIVVACWWIRHGIVTGERVFEELARRREGEPNQACISPETAPQYQLVRRWTE